MQITQKAFLITLMSAVVLFFMGEIPGRAAVDQMQLNLLKHYQLPLRWDNVQDKACLLSGPEPAYSLAYDMHVITLDPGMAVKVKIAENRMLRIISPDACSSLDRLEFSISNGTGLYLFSGVSMDPDRLSALMVPPTDDPSICKIFLPASAESCFKMALFISRQDRLGTLAPFRTMIPLSGRSVSVSQKNTPGTEAFWQVNASASVKATLEGPARIAIETRLLYSPLEQSRRTRYFLGIMMDDRPFTTLDFETPPETSKPVFVDHQPRVCGRVQRAIMHIPDGKHTLEIRPHADVILRVLQQEDSDYLFSKLNAPESYEKTRDELLSRDASILPSGSISAHLKNSQTTMADMEKISRKIVQDNHRSQGGLSGAFLMDQQAKKRPDATGIKQVANELYAAHTFFRGLLPWKKPGTDIQKYSRFILPRLKREQDRYMTVAAQHADQLYNLVQEGSFLQIPGDDAHPLVYRLPTRSAPSTLRIMVTPGNESQAFFIKFHNTRAPGANTRNSSPITHIPLQKPPYSQFVTQNPAILTQDSVPGSQNPEPDCLRFMVEPTYEVPREAFRIIPAEAGLTLNMLRQYFSGGFMPENSFSGEAPAVDTWDLQPVNTGLYMERIITPAFVELNLPTGVDGFSMWGQGGRGMVAVQYLDSVPYRMSESAYLQAVKIAGSPADIFAEFTAQLSAVPGEASGHNIPSTPGEKAGDNTLQGIARQDLRNHQLSLVRMIRSRYALFSASQGGFLMPLPKKSISDAGITKLTRTARFLEKNQQALPALENWAQLFRNTRGAVRHEAAFNMVDQLVLLGETYFAEALLKQLFLQSEKNISDKAFQRLVLFYQKGQTNNSLLPLHCARVVRYPTPGNLRDLSEQLLDEGDFFHAMVLASIIPPPFKPTQLLLKTTGHLGWFKMYGDLLKSLPLQEEVLLWQGMGLLYQKRYKDACNLLKHAGEKGKVLKVAVSDALDIKDMLFSGDKDRRIQGILAWEFWYTHLPGAYYFQNASKGVVDYDGNVMLQSRARDLYSTAFRATPLKSVKARFYGPLKLKVSVRVLHGRHDTLPVNGFFVIRNNKKLQEIPIVNDLPVQGLEIVGTDVPLPGRSITHELSLEPGINEIEVYSDSVPIIAGFEILRPGTPLASILPELRMDNVEAILKADFKATSGRFLHAVKSGPLLNLELSKPVRIMPDTLDMESISWDEFKKRRHDLRSKNKDFQADLPGERERVFKKMAELVMAAHKNPDNTLSMEAEARNLFAKHPHLPGLKSLLEQISIKTAWEPVSMIQADAGIVSVPLEKWQPESDSLRVRKAFFPETFMDDQVISKNNDLVFFMENLKPALIKASISLMDIPFLQPAPVKFFYQVDDHPPAYITLFPQFPDYRFSVPVTTGSHRLTLGIVESYSNQLLKVHFCEAKSMSQPCSAIELDQKPKRLFYAATRKEPVMVNILGPAWVRIDKVVKGDTWVWYRHIKKGWERLVLKPDKDQTQCLFRVHRRTVKDLLPEPNPIRPVKVNYDIASIPHISFQSAKPVKHVWFDDVYPLGKQENGTWSLTGKFKKPFTIQEDKDADTNGHLYELSASHYYYDNTLPGYFKTSFLTRFREQAGPTLGVLEDFYFYPETRALGININAGIYMQEPGADTFDLIKSGSGEYAGLLRARIFQKRSLGLKAFHTPSFSLFARALSMDDEKAYPDHRVDSDVFSSYKNDHKTGSSLSDYCAFMPWLDTVWFLQGAINSNEDLNLFDPDNVKMQVGWKQLLGNLQTDLRYRYSYYFSDDNRSGPIKRNHLDLDLFWNHWTPFQRRLNLGLELSQDLDNNELSLVFSLSWFFSQGRGLTDIRPGSLDFYNIHRRNIPQQNNNGIWSD